jgi:putative tricarboxylic transport membrane protein
MSDTRDRSRLDWGHLSLVLFFAGVTIAYLADAWAASSSLRNLVLLVPVSALSLILCALVVVDIARRPDTKRQEPQEGAIAEAQETGAAPRAELLVERYKPAVLMVLLVLYILTLPWLGFDAGSAVFVAAALVLDGERRIWLIALVSTVFALAATFLFRWLLPYPMPTVIL